MKPKCQLTRVAALLLVALLPAPAPGAEVTSVDVQVEGVDGDVERNVLAHLGIATRSSSKLTEAEIHALHDRAPDEIRIALQPFGFYRPLVTPDLDQANGRWVARYTIVTGPPLLVDTVDVRVTGEGATERPFRRIAQRFPLHRGDPLVHARYEEGKTMFSTTAMRNGYLDARFVEHELQVDLDRYVGTVVLHYDTGPQYRFGPVEFRQDAVDPELLRGYVTFEQGEPLDFNRLLELEQSLGNSPYFSRVEVRPRRDLANGSELPIVVDLVPSKPEKYTFGLGYGTDTGAHARGLVEFRRLNHRGHRGELEGTYSRIEQGGTAKYMIPWPYPRTDVLTLSGGYTTTRVVDSEERTALVGANVSRLWAGWHENFGLQYRRAKYTVGLDQGTGGFLVPEAGWNRLVSDRPVDPGNGRRLIFKISGAHEQLLSAASYLRAEAHAKWIRRFARRTLLTGRVESGYLWTNAFHDLPPSARFFAGGAQSVRGFGFNTLGEHDAAGNVIGGEALAVGSIEYEYRLRRGWGAAVFYDAGNAMHSFRDGLEMGTGVGLRWGSPVGPIRVDLGVPLTEPDHQIHLHLMIGPSL